MSQGESAQFWDTTQCLSLMATEGYHAGSIREQLIQQAFAKVLYYTTSMVYQVTGVRAVPQSPDQHSDVVCNRRTFPSDDPGRRSCRLWCAQLVDTPLVQQHSSAACDRFSPTSGSSLQSLECCFAECRTTTNSVLLSTLVGCPIAAIRPRGPQIDPACKLQPQAISELRAKLSNGWFPNDPTTTNDQNILQADNVTPNLVPSEGYTYPRAPNDVRVLPPKTTSTTSAARQPQSCTASSCSRGH